MISNRKLKTGAIFLSFILPALILYTVFFLIPLSSGLLYSLTKWNGISSIKKYVGLNNFKELFGDKRFLNSLSFTFKYAILNVISINILAFLLALMLDRQIRGIGLLRSIFFLPNVISMIIVGFIWQFFFTNVIGEIANWTGLTFLNQSWLGNPGIAFYSVTLVSVWRGAGYMMIIYLAGLQTINSELIDASRIDGASGWKLFAYIILPLMITCILATLLAMQAQKASIYTMKLLRRGVDIRAGQTVNILRNVRVRDVMRPEIPAVGPRERLLSIVSRFIENPGGSVFIVDPENHLLGVITIDDIRPILNDLDSLDPLLIAQDMMRETGFPRVSPEDRLDGVMTRFGHYRFEAPVVEENRVVGSVWPEDVIRRYEAELFKRDMASSMSSAVSGGVESRAIPGVRGMSMAEIPAPSSFLGRTVAEIAIRKRYDVTILMIKRKGVGEEVVVDRLPNASYVFEEGDVMLVMGREECLRRLEMAP